VTGDAGDGIGDTDDDLEVTWKSSDELLCESGNWLTRGSAMRRSPSV
jgi:hypothetical protein